MSVPRPLPAAPSLEFERRDAKALLKALRAGEPSAVARARPWLDRLEPTHAKLAHAQRVIAREYGFTSWPRLVCHF
jgi:hypothetical protein